MRDEHVGHHKILLEMQFKNDVVELLTVPIEVLPSNRSEIDDSYLTDEQIMTSSDEVVLYEPPVFAEPV